MIWFPLFLGLSLADRLLVLRLLECPRTQPVAVTWKKAESVEARMQAIDMLSTAIHWRGDPYVCEFLASEYTMLAEDAIVNANQCDKLLAKAGEVRDKSRH